MCLSRMNKSVLIYSALTVFSVLVVATTTGFVGYGLGKRDAKLSTPTLPTPTEIPTCAQDTFACPDGTTVGRTGENCEFAACPSPTPWPTVTPNQNPPAVACPQDAKLCPNGSAVGRIGPTCEFAPCPQ